MPHDLDLFDTSDVSYALRRETTSEIVANRVGVTAALFATALGLSALLGGRRRA